MKRMLRYPITNAIGISLFTGFYSLVFFLTSKSVWVSDAIAAGSAAGTGHAFWDGWQSFLLAGHQVYIACALIALSVAVIVLLMRRSHPYDEYHTTLLVSCLVIASILTLLAIAAFYLLILYDPYAMVAKFTMFVVVNWATVVVADLVFVMLCGWKQRT